MLSNRDLGYIRVASCIPQIKICDIDFNISSIEKLAKECYSKGAGLIVFPELCITGYTCGDLFHDSTLLEATERGLIQLSQNLRQLKALVIVGAPLLIKGKLYNCAVAIKNGKIIGAVPKIHLPNYNEFYEKRWFASGYDLHAEYEFSSGNTFIVDAKQLFDVQEVYVGIEICEDLWVPEPPSGRLAKNGAMIIANLSASNELIGKHEYLRNLVENQSARCRCGYVYSSAGFGESSTDLAFAGNAMIAEDGIILAESERFILDPQIIIADIDVQHLVHDRIHFSSFSEFDHDNAISYNPHGEADDVIVCEPLEYRYLDPYPFIDSNESKMKTKCDEISLIQAWGLATRLKAINCIKVVVGISGGLDSTLALLVCVKAFHILNLDCKGIIAVTMPGFGTTNRTKTNADRLMETLGVTHLEIPIADAVNQHFKDINQNPDVHDVTYENSQARERTQLLMDIANMNNALVIGTGDLSELALGWCTYNGDQMSMYAVNSSIPKTMVKYLVKGYAVETDNIELKNTLLDIIDTPISPELLPASQDDNITQKTEDLVGPYELHDFFLYHLMRFGSNPLKIYRMACKAFENKYDHPTVYKWLKTFYKRFFSQQFKRSCMPDGIKVGSICLSPRGDWRMPSDASAKLWLSQLDNIKE